MGKEDKRIVVTTKTELGSSDILAILINFKTGEVIITSEKETSTKKIKTILASENPEGVILQRAFSLAFSTLVTNRVASEVDSAAPVSDRLGELYRATSNFLDAYHTDDELRVLVDRSTKIVSQAAVAENVLPVYLGPALEKLKDEMRRAVVDYRQKLQKN